MEGSLTAGEGQEEAILNESPPCFAGSDAARLRVVTEGVFIAFRRLWDSKSPSTASRSPSP